MIVGFSTCAVSDFTPHLISPLTGRALCPLPSCSTPIPSHLTSVMPPPFVLPPLPVPPHLTSRRFASHLIRSDMTRPMALLYDSVWLKNLRSLGFMWTERCMRGGRGAIKKLGGMIAVQCAGKAAWRGGGASDQVRGWS